MDGNRRWARSQGLETLEGHRQGHEVFKSVVRYVRDAKIPHAVFYAFSTENWKRSEAEVAYLMELFQEMLHNLDEQTKEEKIRVRVVGRREDFSSELQQQIGELEEKTKQYTGTTIWVALSYGGRAEIVAAVNAAIAVGKAVDETTFANYMWTADMPDPDMIIRTSGEQRLSNFLTWHSAYSELHFIDRHWPALTEEDFADILREYESRQRRHGA